MSIQKLISLDTPENWAFPSRALLEIDELQKNVHPHLGIKYMYVHLPIQIEDGDRAAPAGTFDSLDKESS